MAPDETEIVSDVFGKFFGGGHSYLVVVEGPRLGLHVPVTEERTVVGRSEDADLDLEDGGISGRHCRFWRIGRAVMLEDLGSTNGTFLDGVRLETPALIPVGAVLRVGSTSLRHEMLDPREARKKQQLAGSLQQARAYVFALLPPPIEEGPIRATWRYVPSAELGGDAFGYHLLDDRHLAVYLLDVCGHGVGPALHTASALNILRKQALPGVDFRRPEQVAGALNRTFKMEDHKGLYFTLWYGVHDAETGKLCYCAAGHPPAFLVTEAGKPPRELHTRNLPIGMMEDVSYESAEAEIPYGGRLFVFSDGAYEVRTAEGPELSIEEFAAILAAGPAPGLTEPERVERAIRERMASAVFEDDFSLLALEFGA